MIFSYQIILRWFLASVLQPQNLCSKADPFPTDLSLAYVSNFPGEWVLLIGIITIILQCTHAIQTANNMAFVSAVGDF